MTTRIPDQTCPYCGRNIGATMKTKDTDQRPPEPGDLSLCFYCGEVAKFDNNMILIKLEPEELIKVLRENPYINNYHKKILAMGRIK